MEGRLNASCELYTKHTHNVRKLYWLTTGVDRRAFADFCSQCREHEAMHVNGRCLLAAAKFTAACLR